MGVGGQQHRQQQGQAASTHGQARPCGGRCPMARHACASGFPRLRVCRQVRDGVQGGCGDGKVLLEGLREVSRRHAVVDLELGCGTRGRRLGLVQDVQAAADTQGKCKQQQRWYESARQPRQTRNHSLRVQSTHVSLTFLPLPSMSQGVLVARLRYCWIFLPVPSRRTRIRSAATGRASREARRAGGLGAGCAGVSQRR